MKRYFLIFALAAACLIACDSEEDTNVNVPEPPEEQTTPQDPPVDPPQPPVDEPVKPAPGTYTFVLPDFAGKPAWEAGDEISIRGNYVPTMMSITLEANQISADGKTATVELTELPPTFCDPDWLYAAYPGGDVEFDSSFCDDITRFVGYGPRLVAYWKEGNSFEFKAGNAAVTFSVSGDYDSFVFGGSAREDILFDYTTVQYSSVEDVLTRKPSDGHPFITGELPEDGQCVVFLPSRTQFKGGFSIYMKKGDTYPMVYNYTQNENMRVGQVIELGDITASLVAYDGPAPEEMEMPVITKRTEYKVNVEELSGICLTEEGDALWGVGDQGQLAKIYIDEAGKVTIQNIKNFNNDCEGVTRDPDTGTLYICTEPNSVYRVAADYQSYTRLFKVEEASNYGNSGLEGIAWYKDNTLYVGSQVGANLWRYDLEGNILDFISLKTVRSTVQEIGGLCYDPVNDWLWVTDSEAHSLWVFSGDARTYYGRYKLSSGYNNESVTVDHAHSCVWVGDDNDSQPKVIRLDMEGLTRGEL